MSKNVSRNIGLRLRLLFFFQRLNLSTAGFLAFRRVYSICIATYSLL